MQYFSTLKPQNDEGNGLQSSSSTNIMICIWQKKLNHTHPNLKQYIVKSFGEMYQLDDSWEWEWPHVYLPFSHICEWHGIRISGMIDKFV